LSLFPPFLEYFQHVSFFHFHTWVHNMSIFILLHPFLISSSFPLMPVTRKDLFYLPILHFWKKTFLFVQFLFVQDSCTGSFIVTHIHTHVQLFFFPLSGGTRGEAQGLMHAREVLHHWFILPPPTFLCIKGSDIVSMIVIQNILLFFMCVFCCMISSLQNKYNKSTKNTNYILLPSIFPLSLFLYMHVYINAFFLIHLSLNCIFLRSLQCAFPKSQGIQLYKHSKIVRKFNNLNGVVM
jgi:hypothetical protein